MTVSNSVGFSWTEEKSSIFLEIMTHLVISKKLDPLVDRTIEMVLSKLCELANHPYVIGFLQTTCKIWMRPEVYEMHIKLTLIQF